MACVVKRLALVGLVLALGVLGQPARAAEPGWTIYVANDNCPDYTWGLTEAQTRRAFADVVKGHLDEMTRTDGQAPESRSRYNAAVTQEVLCFLEHYPDRKAELIRRVKEGRLYVSPYLCNSLWAFQGLEGAIRTFYPARRLQREWGFPMDTAHHIELPSLPWGTSTILAGCGIRNLSVPYYGYDSTFSGLTVPPLFALEGPDGSRIRVCLDHWASQKASYTQGAALLGKPDAIQQEWIAHYAGLRPAYPVRSILASGTHGDISPGSGSQARGFAEAIARYNARPDKQAKLVNATLPQFWQAVDAELARPGATQLPVVCGCFGHSWDLWPVSLASSVARMRRGESLFLSAEALLAIAGSKHPEVHQATLAKRQRAEWCWAMLSDHAWNGTDGRNKAHNAELRKNWSQELIRLSEELLSEGWKAAGLVPDESHVTVFNPLSAARADLVSLELAPGKEPVSVWEELPLSELDKEAGASAAHVEVPSQVVSLGGSRRVLYFVPYPISGYACERLELRKTPPTRLTESPLAATPEGLKNRTWRVTIDRETGGIGRLVPVASRFGVRDMIEGGPGRGLGQTTYFDGREHALSEVRSEVVAGGPLVATVRTRGKIDRIEVTTEITLYDGLELQDRIDLAVSVRKPVGTKQERLCQLFPLLGEGRTLRVATPGAVIRPRRQPEGDLLPGADLRRVAVGDFFDVAAERYGVTVVPHDAFALRLDLDPLAIEALGNDQNYREVVQDQQGDTEFTFRYTLRARLGTYSEETAALFSRGILQPLLPIRGRLADPKSVASWLFVDGGRAIGTCLKPAEDGPPGSILLRLREVAGREGPITLGVAGFRTAVETDLLERDLKPLPMKPPLIKTRQVDLDLKPHGLAAVRLVP